jgi:RNA polymerase sigma-70 factor, ECF subfamily
MSVLPPTVGNSADPVRETVDAVYRSESRRVLATLIRLLGDFELAEEALHDAFAAAIQQWPQDGIPANPRAWLVTTGRFKAIDSMRRRARFDASVSELARRLDTESAAPVEWEEPGVEDDRPRSRDVDRHPTAENSTRAVNQRKVSPDSGQAP